jgi:hypothetical protein
VAGHEGAVAEVVIDVIIAIEVADVAAVALGDEERIGFVEPVIAGDTQRDAFDGLLVGFVRTGRALLVEFYFFL